MSGNLELNGDTLPNSLRKIVGEKVRGWATKWNLEEHTGRTRRLKARRGKVRQLAVALVTALRAGERPGVGAPIRE